MAQAFISNSMRDVRVTERSSVRAPFVAPDMAPVRKVDLELDKGIPGWTDRDVKIETAPADAHKAVGHADRELDELVIRDFSEMTRKAPTGNVVRRQRPTKRRWK